MLCSASKKKQSKYLVQSAITCKAASSGSYSSGDLGTYVLLLNINDDLHKEDSSIYQKYRWIMQMRSIALPSKLTLTNYVPTARQNQDDEELNY